MKTVLAFSGGLDTSFCVPFLKNECGTEVVTVTVDTGGFSKEELEEKKGKALALGAVKHVSVDAKQEVYDGFISYVVKGNATKNGYPLCVSVERVVQAKKVAKIALQEKADAVAHGSSGVGNDQVRFDTAFAVVASGLKVMAPVRDNAFTRKQEYAYLAENGFAYPEKTETYSINAGLWGKTISGGQIHDPSKPIPEEVFGEAGKGKESVEIAFEKGLPVALDGKEKNGVKIVEELNALGAKQGVGRGVHVGDTIIGVKGRIAFEAPAAEILLKAHLELEKLVLTKKQLYWSHTAGAEWAEMVHEANYFDPACRALEALVDCTQEKVEGTAVVELYNGNARVTGCNATHSWLGKVKYAEESALWTAADAKGFSKIHGMQSILSNSVV